MTMIDDRPELGRAEVDRREVDRPSTDRCVIEADGAYCTDVLRVVRGTPNPEELAALVAALLLTRRAHEENLSRAPEAQQRRPTWPRDRYTAPGSWAAGP
jgi:acyl-CoA carboxylase epsilon subunit-like protein